MARKKNPNQRKQMLELLEQGNCGKEIAQILGVSKAVISKRIKGLESENLINSSGGSPKFYKLTQAGKVNLMSLGVRTPNKSGISTPHFRGNQLSLTERKAQKNTKRSDILDKFMYIHDYKVKFKIVQHGSIPENEGITRKIKNWTKRFFDFQKPNKLRIELTTQSMIIYVSDLKMPIEEPLEAFLVKFHARLLTKITEFAKKYGYILDYQNPKVVSQHIANQLGKPIDQKIPKHLQQSIRLGRAAESITGPMNQEGQVWIDKSRTWAELETNDNNYAKLMQEVPIRVKNIDQTTQITAQDVSEIKSAMKELGQFHDAISLYTKQINLHLEAVNNINQNQIKFNTSLDKFTSILERLERKIR